MEQNRKVRPAAIATAVATMALTVGVALPAAADTGTDTSALRDAVSAGNIMDHLEALQAVADANDGTRAAGTPGYEASAQYIEQQLRDAGYDPVRQPFSYDQFSVIDASLDQVSPSAVSYTNEEDFSTMSYSGVGTVEAAVTAVDINLSGDLASTSGCESEDFAGFTAGDIALIQRGTCTFRVKADLAIAAGAAGVIIFNQGNVVPGDDRVGLLAGTLDPPQVSVPVVGATFALGQELAGIEGLTVRLSVDATLTLIESFNVLADTGGREDRTVVAGAHLDSVAEGPGINDNGSGSAAVLETALQMAELGIEPTNRVRFAFWGGEEDGLIGSEFYVSQLTKRQVKDHAVNLNFDMVASPNPVRFVYDGDGSAFGTSGPNGSATVEEVFLDYFESQGLATAPTEFDGRSDYFGFINSGIPAGGLFTGAEGIKTEEEAAVFGGVAGAPYDPCYHQACDDINNLDAVVLEEMADAIAHATLTFGDTGSAINGTAKGQGTPSVAMDFKADMSLR